jgi:D-lyxose ketol-isomerase
MKRSQINACIRSGDEFIRQCGFHLPPFAYWTAADWGARGAEAREIVDCHLGWDVTDFNLGDFHKAGLFLFTVRNGRPENWKTLQGKLYAEKIMVVEEGQVTPFHFHWSKMEDIICRAGGSLELQLFHALPDEEMDRVKAVTVSIDGMLRTFAPGETFALHPGESITLPPYCYHSFWGSGARVLVGEVSLVNDDQADNRFYGNVPRFSGIEEDEAPLYPLCTETARYFHPG